MLKLFFIVMALGVGFLLGGWWGRRPKDSRKDSLIERQGKEKRKHKQKILGLFGAQDAITNNDVEKLLGVSDATAERYLQELENEGHLKQVGKTGKHVYYSKI